MRYEVMRFCQSLEAKSFGCNAISGCRAACAKLIESGSKISGLLNGGGRVQNVTQRNVKVDQVVVSW